MTYRQDIDGLRALAVLPIVLIHTQLWRLPAGFAGVDIFFVISGYLITGILLHESEVGGIDLPGFYRRRIVRIVPALVAMLVLVLIAAQLLLFAPDIRRVGLSAASAAALVANFGAWLRTGYFEHGARWEPLLHSWSLGVEEQFYLLYPLLLYAVMRFWRKRLVPILAAITVLSFVAGFAIGTVDQNAQYYLLPSRAWELTLGALVAAGATPRLKSPRLRDGAAIAGLGLTLASFFLLPGTRGFPVPWALIPCTGTALLLAYGGDAATARLLSLAPLRAIGLISYSLYLWHWPIIVFYRLMFGEIASTGTSAGLALAALAMAALSYWLIECPARRRWRNAPPRRVILAGIAAIMLTVAMALSAAFIAARAKPTESAARAAAWLNYVRSDAYRAQFRSGSCFLDAPGQRLRPECIAIRRDRPNALLLGDSYAAHLWQALAERFPGVNLMQANAATCRPVIETRGARYCTQMVQHMLGGFIADADVSRVVLAASWKPGDAETLAATIRAIRGKGIAVTVIGPVNEYDGEVPRLLATAIRAGDPSRIDRHRLDGPAKVEQLLRPRVEAAGGHYISLIDLECPGGLCRPLTPQGAPFHFDGAHLTPEGARSLAQGIGGL